MNNSGKFQNSNIKLQKATMIVNACLLLFVLLMSSVFWNYGINIMLYYSMFAICFYCVAFVIILKNYLTIYVWLLYAVITCYMDIATVCIGIDSGFHLYSMSLLPILFYIEYVAIKTHGHRVYPVLIATIIIAAYLLSSSIVLMDGPIYAVDRIPKIIMLWANSVSVFAFIISYSKIMLQIVFESEKKLLDAANTDRLTGLYNRHFVLEYLEKLESGELEKGNYYIALSDIDDFKKINDTYGHNAGDYVLKHISDMAKPILENEIVARWGGEEYIYVINADRLNKDVFENLRKNINSENFIYEGQKINVSMTIGVVKYNDGEKIEDCIHRADNNLYRGKASGKNQVVF